MYRICAQVDRFALDLQLTPTEAMQHMRRIIENVNALSFTLLTSESIISEQQQREELASLRSSDGRVAGTPVDTGASNDALVDQWTFSPEKGNVIFCSAMDCWGFGTLRFANMYAKKYGVNKGVLNRYMFEDYFLNPTTKKIVKCDPDNSSHVPMFVSLILEPIWNLYSAAMTERDPHKAAKYAEDEVRLFIF